MNNKAFTLVELLAVIVILSILLTITIIFVGNIVSDSETNLLDIQKKNIETAAKVYYLKEGMNSNADCVNVSDLINKGYIEGTEVIDPETNLAMTGSVSITYASNQYNYQYQDKSCQLPRYYHWGSGSISGGLPTTNIDTDVSNINTNNHPFYLAFDSEDGTTVSAAYVCFAIGESKKEYCLKGADEDAYGDNQDILREAFPSCPEDNFGGAGSDCSAGGLSVDAYLNGDVYARGGDYAVCSVGDGGGFYCNG